MTGFPLVGRPDGAVLFRDADRAIDTATFLARAHDLADALPEAPVIVNLCRDRFLFAAIIAACVLRGIPAVLAGDRSPEMLRRIGMLHPGAMVVAEDAPDSPLPVWQPRAEAGRDIGCDAGPNPIIPAAQLAAIVFTSGSTGAPVAHRKSWGQLADRSITAGQAFALNHAAPASVIGTVPPQHMYGFETTVLQPLHAPSATLCGDAFYPADIAALLRAAPAPRILVTTPLQLRALLQADAELPALHAIISATAPLDAALAAQAETRWATWVLEIYGATEIGSVAHRRTTAGPDWRLYPGLDLLAEDDGYALHAPHALPHTLADRIEIQPDGFRLIGRQNDLVKLGGRRASLAGLNEILIGVDGVQDGVFVPPRDDAGPNARMTAFVVAPHTAPDRILAALRDRIDPAFLPRRVIALPALPRNDTGKLPAQALDALLRAHMPDLPVADVA